MKEIILSADGDSVVYLVPDEVADNLAEYCIEFCDSWIWGGPEAERYIINGVAQYDVSDFIEYLNNYLFPEQKSVMIKNLGWTDLGRNLPGKYRFHPYFNF